MRINGKAKGKVKKFEWSRNKKRDGKVLNVDFIVRVNEEQCESLFGFEFRHGVAFAGMAKRATVDADGKPDGGEEIVHLVNKPKPSKKMVMEIHKIKMLGRTIDGVQPAVQPLDTIQGRALVDVTVRIPVDIGIKDGFYDKLFSACESDDDCMVEFSPKQGELQLK